MTARQNRPSRSERDDPPINFVWTAAARLPSIAPWAKERRRFSSARLDAPFCILIKLITVYLATRPSFAKKLRRAGEPGCRKAAPRCRTQKFSSSLRPFPLSLASLAFKIFSSADSVKPTPRFRLRQEATVDRSRTPPRRGTHWHASFFLTTDYWPLTNDQWPLTSDFWPLTSLFYGP